MEGLKHYEDPGLYTGQSVNCNPGVTGQRTLKNGREVPEYNKVMPVSIHSRCPGKWLLVDLQTGESWQPDEGLALRCAKPEDKALAVEILKA